MDRDSLRNTITFIVLAVIILIAYQTFVLGPQAARRAAEQRAAAAHVQAQPGRRRRRAAFRQPGPGRGRQPAREDRHAHALRLDRPDAARASTTCR